MSSFSSDRLPKPIASPIRMIFDNTRAFTRCCAINEQRVRGSAHEVTLADRERYDKRGEEKKYAEKLSGFVQQLLPESLKAARLQTGDSFTAKLLPNSS